jgi:hypothetical protein
MTGKSQKSKILLRVLAIKYIVYLLFAENKKNSDWLIGTFCYIEIQIIC